MTGKLPINIIHLLREYAFEGEHQTLPLGTSMSKGFVRTVINLDDKQKAWLDRQASLRRVSRSSLIRLAISEYQAKESRVSIVSFQEALKHTAGIWQSGEGLEYQVRIRKEWP